MKDLCRNNFLSIVSIGITLMKSKQFAVKGVNFVIFQLYMVRYNSKYVIITKIVIIVKFCNYDLLTTLPETMLYPIFRYIRACTERVLLYYFHSVNHKMLVMSPVSLLCRIECWGHVCKAIWKRSDASSELGPLSRRWSEYR